MDPYYNSTSGYNNNASHRPTPSNQHLNPNNQILNNPSVQHAAVPVSNSAPSVGGVMPNYSTSYNAKGNSNNAQYRIAAPAATGRPMQTQHGVYGQQSVPNQQLQQQQQQPVAPPPFASPSLQPMYDHRTALPAAAATGVGFGVPNPLCMGGAPAPGGAIPTSSAPPTGASKTDLLRSMYQSRQQPQLHQPQQPQLHQPQQPQLQGQVLQDNYRTASQSPAAGYGQVNVAPTIQQGMQSTYQQQPHAQIIQQQQQRQMPSQSIQQVQHANQQQQQQQAYQQLQHQSNRMGIAQKQYVQQTQQVQVQQGIPTSQPQQQQHRSSQLSEQSSAQQASSQPAKQRFHLTPQAKVALREAVLSAIRHPNGIVDPSCLQRAMAEGLPEKAVLNAAVVARERDKRNRDERIRAGGQTGQQVGVGQGQQGQGLQQRPVLPQQVHQSQLQPQHQQPQGGVVHHSSMPQRTDPSFPSQLPPSNVASASANVQMQQMFSGQPSNGGTVQYGQTSAALEQNRMYQQQQQQQQQQQAQQQAAQLQAQQQQAAQLQARQQQAAQLQAQQQQAAQRQAQQQQAAQHQAQQQQAAQLQAQQQQVAQLAQQRQQQQMQQQQLNLTHSAQMTTYQQQFQAQQINIAAQRQQEESRKQQLQQQYQQEQQRRMLEVQRKRKETEAEQRVEREAARRNAELLNRMKGWGRTGFGLVVKGYAKGLPKPQQGKGQRSVAVLRQSIWGGTSMCLDGESALVGALHRVMKGEMEETPKSHAENTQKAVDFIRKQLLIQPQTSLAPPSKEDLCRKRSLAISNKLLDPQRAHSLQKRLKLQPKREGKFLDKHIRRAREMTAVALAKRQKELLKAIVAHQSEFYKFHRLKRNECAKIARTIRDQLRKAEVAKEKETETAEKARIAALRANDMAAYTSLLEDTKNERLKYLLDKTDECMNRISTLLASRAEEEEEDIKLMGGDGAIQAQFTQEVTGGSYYETAHVKTEQVRQPSLLVGGELKEYQLSGLQWLVSLYNNRLNGILADEMGLGKTIQTISLIAYLIEEKQILGPYLVIVPLSTLSNWVNEFAKWLPAVTLVCYKGTPQQRKQLFRDEVADGHFNVLLTTYEFVIRDKGSLKKIAWQYAIVDEGHRMKNNQSKFSITLGTQYQTRRRVLLTGTPLQNNLPELWALLNFLLPAIFNSAESFDQWFNKPFSSFGKNTTSDNGDDSSNELLSNEERMLIIHRLHELLRPFMLRRIKSEVLDQLPEKVEKVIRCELSSWQKELYKQISRKIAGEAATKNFNRGLNNVVMQLRKVCNHPYLFSQDGYHINDDIIRTSGKVELLDRMLPKLKAAGHRVLMFTQMTKMMPILEDYFSYRGFTSLRLDGSTTADEREKRMYMFNAPDSPFFIFLLSTRAGGLGLNLATADTVIIFDSDWNPMMDLQAQDRAHRIGQRKDVRVFRIITQSPVEEKILSRATEKLQMNELVVEAGKFDKSGQDKEDNSLERLKMMELLLDNFDQNQNAQGAATSEEDFEKDTDDGDEEYSGDLLNEMISTNDDDYKLYCKMDIARTNAPALYADLNDCPDWIRYPNGKPEEGEELFDDDLLLGKRRAAAGDKVYDDGMTEKQFCRMMDKQASEEENGKKKRKKKRNRNAVDTSLILEDDDGARKRSKTMHLQLDDISSRSKAGSSSASGFGIGEVSAAMYDRLLSITRSIIYLKEKGTKRKLSDIFLEKPCPQTYPDYYQLIDKPIGMNDILRKCRAKLYSSANDFLDDWNTLFKNALTYNGESSWIVNDAEVIRGELDRLMEKNALSALEKNALSATDKKAFGASVAESKKPVRIKLSLKMGKKKGPTGNGVTTPVATTVDSDDESDSHSESDDNSGIVSVIKQEAIKQEARCPKKRKRPTS